MKTCVVLLMAVGSLAAVHADSILSLPTDSWSGRPTHLAVVNPAVPADDGSVLSLRGEWEFARFRHALEARDLRYEKKTDFWGRESPVWKNVRKITVPGCWEAQGVGKPGPGYGYNGKKKEPGTFDLRHVHFGNGFYRRTVTVPSAWKGKRVWFKLGRAHTWAWMWVNGKAVAHVSEGYRALKWDITDLVEPGRPAEIVVQVDNSYVGFRNTQILSIHRWGGLIRDVELEATPQTFIDDAWCRGDFDARQAEINVAIAGGGGRPALTVRADVEGRTVSAAVSPSVSRHTLHLPLPAFRPWSPEHPNLYTAKVELVSADGTVLQRRYERFGVRKLEVRGKEFYLNGRPFFVRGFGDDSTYPITGCSPASKEAHLRNLRIARAAGFNFVRTHTHVELPEYFDAADEAGILVEAELSYNCDESSVETFLFDPVGDAKAVWQGYRRHPSFAVYSGGNEGTLGPNGGKALFDWVHATDPDRLVVEQDGGTYLEKHRTDTSDFASGPMSMWERGSFNVRAFICHEYANLAVKADARMEDDYNGIWMPRMTRRMRRDALAPFGLGEAWGERLQDAQHDLQRFWALRSVEHARKDPFCDGYIYWTIVDYTHYHEKFKVPNCQGLFDPFWRAKPHGTRPEEMLAVNATDGIYLDTENRVRRYREDPDPLLCCGSINRVVMDETNRVYAVGETIHADFILSRYGEAELTDTSLDWRLVADGRTLCGGTVETGEQRRGPARSVAKVPVVVPPLARPVKARLEAEFGGKIRNGWDFWLFPRLPRPEIPSDVVVAEHGSAAAEAARKAGRNLLLTGDLKGERDIMLGWWALDWRWPHDGWTQNGVAVLRHPLFRLFPYEPYLSPLLFGMIGQGTPLPVAGFEEKDYIMLGEGNDDFKLYLAAKTRPDGGKEVFVSGLDVFRETVEARALLADIVRYLSE